MGIDVLANTVQIQVCYDLFLDHHGFRSLLLHLDTAFWFSLHELLLLLLPLLNGYFFLDEAFFLFLSVNFRCLEELDNSLFLFFGIELQLDL